MSFCVLVKKEEKLLGIVALFVFAYVWGDLRVALFIAIGFALAKALLKK